MYFLGFLSTFALIVTATQQVDLSPRDTIQQNGIPVLYRFASGTYGAQCPCQLSPGSAVSSPASGTGAGPVAVAVGAGLSPQGSTGASNSVGNDNSPGASSGTGSTPQVIAQYVNGEGLTVQVVISIRVDTVVNLITSTIKVGPGVTSTLTTTSTVLQTITVTTTTTGGAAVSPTNTATSSSTPYANSTTPAGTASVSAVQTLTSLTSLTTSATSISSTCAFIPPGCTSAVQQFCSSLAAQGPSTMSQTTSVSSIATTSTMTGEVTVVSTVLSFVPSDTETIVITSIVSSSTTTSVFITSSTTTTTTGTTSTTLTPAPVTMRKRAAGAAQATTIGTCAIPDYTAACACLSITLSSRAPSSTTQTNVISVTASAAQTISTTSSVTNTVLTTASVTSTSTTTTTVQTLTSTSITTTTSTSSSTTISTSVAPTVTYTPNFALQAFDPTGQSIGFVFYLDSSDNSGGGEGFARVTGPRPANQPTNEFAFITSSQTLVLSNADGTHAFGVFFRNTGPSNVIGFFFTAQGDGRLYCRSAAGFLSCGFSATTSGSFGQCGSNGNTFFNRVFFFDLPPTADINQACQQGNYGFGQRITLQIVQ